MTSLPTPPQSSPLKGPSTPHRTRATFQPSTLSMSSPTPTPSEHLPPPSVQTAPAITPPPARLQQDILILTSFNDNSSLHWRPAWFPHQTGLLWTLHNPPNVVTERLPTNGQHGMHVYTRRMRRPGDPAPLYMKTWEDWGRYCALYGVPRDFLCEEHVRVMREGLPRNAAGSVCAPPSQPLYPEPPLQGRYALRSELYVTHLPHKFAEVEDGQVVVVEADGRLVGEYWDAGKEQVVSREYRWSWVPWTEAMEGSCRPWALSLRRWNG